MESLALEEGGLQVCTDWRLLVWGSCGRAPQSRASHRMGWLFPVVLKMGASLKLGKLPVHNHVLAVLDQLLPG